MLSARDRRRLRVRRGERLFWVWLYRLWPGYLEAIALFKPDTLMRWHRQGFRGYWTWRSQRRASGRPPTPAEIQDLIRRISRENPRWGAPRVHGELQMLGIPVTQTTVAKYMGRQGKPPRQTWRTFLNNHVKDLVSIDFFTVPTATFRILYVLVVLRHDRRRVVHFNAAEHPTAQRITQQVVEAFPFDTALRYLLREHDAIYGSQFQRRVHSLGIDDVLIAPRSPWQSQHVERLIGSIRRECLNHIIGFNELHLKRLLRSYFDYYLTTHTQLALAKQCPEPRPVQLLEQGKVIALPHVGGLHHEYRRAA